MTTKEEKAEAKADAAAEKAEAKEKAAAKKAPKAMGFPTDWPREQFTICADWLASGNLGVPPREVAEAAYDIEGFALGQVYDAFSEAPPGVMAATATVPVAPPRAEASFVLRGCGLQSSPSVAMAAAPFDWGQVVAIVLSIIQQFWKR